MDITTEESKRILRRIELEAYSALVTALRAQGELDRQKKRLLRDLGEQLSISTERHRAEIRRAISDDRLSMIAECVCGSDACVEWESEGRRVVPLMPRLVPQTAFTGTATAAANQAANVNSTIPSTAKAQSKDVAGEELRSRKRQKTCSPSTIQKVIVSSAPKTSTSSSTVRSNNAITKEPARFLKTPTLPVKQENMSSASVKMTSSGSVSSKPIILGGTKSSSVSVAPSKYVAPLPASCLQAHASVVSGNKNRMNLNVVKTKPKPKIKSLAASVNIKPVSTAHGTTAVPSSVAHSVVQSVAQSLLSAANIKGNEISSSTSKTVHVSRSTSTITVAPRSSISLTAYKSAIQSKSSTPVPPVTARNVEGASRQNPGQLGKAVSVSRLSRPLPAILPKTIPISTPGRKLASILPAPAKSKSSTLPNSLIVPVGVSSTSSPIPIAPAPHPPQSFTAGLSNTVMNKVTTVSTATGHSGDVKKESQDAIPSNVKVQSPVLFGKSPAGSLDSSPMSSKSLDNIHEREALSPVSEILTLVSSPSSVPFVPSSPIKSLSIPLASGAEISLECDENLLEDLMKDEEVQVKRRREQPRADGDNGVEERKDVFTSSKFDQTSLDAHQEIGVGSIARFEHSLPEDKSHVQSTYGDASSSVDKPSDVLSKPSDLLSKPREVLSKPIDLSPLVNELISSSPFDILVEKKQFENPDASDHAQSDTDTASDGDMDDVTGSEDVNNLFVGGLLDTDSSLTNVSEETKSNVDDVVSAVKQKEKVSKLLSPVEEQNSDSRVLEQTLQQESMLDATKQDKRVKIDEVKTDEAKKEISEVKGVPSGSTEQAKSSPINVNITDSVSFSSQRDENTESLARSNRNVGVKDNDKLEITVRATIEESGKHGLCTISKQEESTPCYLETSAGSVCDTQEGKRDAMSVSTINSTSPQDVIVVDTQQTSGETSGGLIQTESIKTIEDKSQQAFPASKLGSRAQQPEDKEVAKNESHSNEIVKLNTNENKSNLPEGRSTDNIPHTTRKAEESCDANVNQPVEVTLEPSNRDDEGSIEEQLSSSDSFEGNLVRTSNRKRKAPPPRDLSVHPPGWVRSALQLLQKVSRFRGSSRSKNARSAASWFLKPVGTSEAPGYYKVIKTPMDFGTIKTKLEAGEYSAAADFHRDMLLVKSNCCKYNPPGHIVRKDCDEVFQFYEAEYERFVEKLDKIYLPTPKKQKASPV